MPIILILLGGILILSNIKIIKKDEKPFEYMLKCRKEEITDVEIQLGSVRKDVAESFTEIQMEIIGIKKDIKDLQEKLEFESKTIYENNEKQVLLQDDEVINKIGSISKSDKVNKLVDMGFTEDEICEKLSLGKGEVLLIKGLYKR